LRKYNIEAILISAMERPKPESRLSPYLIAALTASAILLAVVVVDQLEQQRFAKVREARILRNMSNVRARLEGELNAQLFLTRGLVAYVSTHPEITLGEFRGLAGVLFSQPGSSGIRSIQLAKNSVVTHIYPLKGNEAALGLRLLEHPEQKTAAKRVLDTKDTVLAGPLKLVQGGTAFVSRTPIYLTPRGGPPNSGEYWGHAGILIDEGILFSRTGILQDTDGLEYALRGRDGMGAKGEVFFGDPRVFDSTPLVLDIQIPGGSWQLAAVTLPGVLSTSSNLWLLRAGGGLLAITAAALAFFATLYNRRRSQEKLRETSRQAEEKFQALAENAQDAIVSADSLGNIIYFNKAAQRAFGYEASEVVGQPLTLLIPDRVRNQPLREVTRFIAEGEAHVVGKVIDVMGRKKSGTEFPVELSLGTWTTQEGKFVTGIFRDITERTQIAEAINEQRAFLRQVIDIDPNFIFAKDRQGRFTLVNQAVADAFGTTVQEVIGKRDTDFTADAQEVESFRSMDLEVMETLQERFIPEERITDAQGKIRWLQSVKRPIIGADGKATLVLGSSTDITHRKLVEEKLLQNQKQYAMATAAGGVSVWALDAKTGELHTDPVLPAQLGIDVAESYPRDLWTKHIHPEDLERLLENERRMLDATAPRNEEGNTLMPEIEFRGLRSDGRVIWFFGRGTVIWDKDRKPLRTIGTCTDITARKQVEAALRESEERLARTETFSLVMVTHLDLDGRWIKVPPTLCELLRHPEAELLGHRFHETTHPEDIEADWSQCLRLIHGEIKSFDLEKRFIRKDNQIVWVYLNCSVVTDTQDRPVHFLTYIRDITNRKLNEEKLREYQESLRQLANELNTTEERERQRFAADLHDHIGQSLVLAKLELGRLGELAGPLDENVQLSIERLDDTIDQALHETRSLTQDLSPQVLYAFGFDAALDWLAENMQERYDLVCHVEGGKQPSPLTGDAAVVAFQAVRELLINVVKHAGVKEARVYVTQRENMVVVHVEDQGKGFVPEELHLPRSHGGGFGLFSIRERLSLLGGSLAIHSNPGKGTSAQVVIPVSVTDSTEVFHELNL
jgi:PAS domain S-box-containing protein